METNQLSLDEIVSKAEGYGILSEKDNSLSSLKRYKFAVSKDIAANIIDDVKSELLKVRNYSIGRNVESGDVEKGWEFNHRRFPEKEDTSFWDSLPRHFLDIIGATDPYFFGGIYMLLDSSARTYKVKIETSEGIVTGKKIVPPQKNTRIIMIDGFYKGGVREPFVDLMRVFILAYEKNKS